MRGHRTTETYGRMDKAPFDGPLQSPRSLANRMSLVLPINHCFGSSFPFIFEGLAVIASPFLSNTPTGNDRHAHKHHHIRRRSMPFSNHWKIM